MQQYSIRSRLLLRNERYGGLSQPVSCHELLGILRSFNLLTGSGAKLTSGHPSSENYLARLPGKLSCTVNLPYRLAIFDIDGTLLDSFAWFLTIVNAVAGKHRFRPIEADQVEALRGKETRELLKLLEVPLWKLPAIGRDMRALKASHLDDIALFPGVAAMLRELSARGVMLAIVSSDNEANVRRALGKDNAVLIGHYACGASLFGKAAKFRRVLKAAGMAAANVICIGDEVRDAEAARDAGIAFGAVTWGYATESALRAQAPAVVFSKMEDIVAAFG